MRKRSIVLGFSLVEMAIVLAIVTLLLAGLLPTISSQIELQNRNETRKQLEEIRAALVGFALSQSPPRLPCPADRTKPTGSSGAGIENCTILTGVLPWVTLGTNETDGWGRRYTYSVPASAPGSFTSGFTLTSTSPINVLSAGAGGIVIASGVPAVIISHGPNGLGAYLPNGSQLPTDATHTDELANSDEATPFISHDNSPNFDDLVVWLSPNTLFNRMVAAGKLP